MKSTIALFRYLCEHLPPLFSSETAEKMKHALEHLEQDQTVSLDQVEKTMISFGYEIWPYNQAYREFLALAENKVGEHFLLPKLSAALQKKYDDFKVCGGTLRDLHSGRPAVFFTAEERTQLCTALVDLQTELRKYADREILGLNKKKYLERVESFKDLLKEIKKKMEELKKLAAGESDHPTLAAEIREQVKSFEYGLCLLGPNLDYEAVCQSVDFFVGRKIDLNHMRGIHVPKQVDFY